jgi:hypothetical protein
MRILPKKFWQTDFKTDIKSHLNKKGNVKVVKIYTFCHIFPKKVEN